MWSLTINEVLCEVADKSFLRLPSDNQRQGIDQIRSSSHDAAIRMNK